MGVICASLSSPLLTTGTQLTFCRVRYTQPVILEHIPFPAIESKPEGQPESANTSTSLVYLPITRTQPPRPPRRRSSLSYSKLRRNIYIEVSPSAPLSAFTLGEEDGRAWQWSVTRDSYQDPLWTLLLQVGSVESCVRHLVLTYAQLNSCPFRIPVDDECRRRRVRIHYHAALLMLRCGLGREMALIASYLLARIHSSLNDGSGATFWLQTGRRILKRALHDSTGGNDRCMRCVARALCREAWSGRVEIRT